MGILTDFWFGLSNMFTWLFENTFEPIDYPVVWILFIVGMGFMIWWLYQLIVLTGHKQDKDYDGW